MYLSHTSSANICRLCPSCIYLSDYSLCMHMHFSKRVLWLCLGDTEVG